MRGVVTVREHENLENAPALTKQDMADLEAVAKKVLKRKDGDLAASNYVGVVTTKRGVVVEILPKIDLGGEEDPDYEKTRRTFLRMLRCWRGLSEASTVKRLSILTPDRRAKLTPDRRAKLTP